MNVSEYQRHRRRAGLAGSSRAAVYNAIQEGRISTDADGRIDPVKADLEWSVNTQRRRPGRAILESEPPPVDAGEEALLTWAARVYSNLDNPGTIAHHLRGVLQIAPRYKAVA